MSVGSRGFYDIDEGTLRKEEMENRLPITRVNSVLEAHLIYFQTLQPIESRKASSVGIFTRHDCLKGLRNL